MENNNENINQETVSPTENKEKKKKTQYEEEAGDEVDYKALYAPVFDEVFEVLDYGFNIDKEYKYVSGGLSEKVMYSGDDDLLNSIGYQMTDLSGDGVPELYYITEPLCMNGKNNNYSYKLKAVLPERTLSTKAKLVGNASFDAQSLGVNFSKEYFGTRRPFLFRPAINASFYQAIMSFTFLEQRTPDGDSVPRTMTWNLGYWDEYDLSIHMEGDCYVFYYRPETFYEMLRDFIGGDTIDIGVQRFITDYPMAVTIAAGGEKLGQYIYNNDASNGFHPGDNEFSLIDGGYGVFSSRMTSHHTVRLAGETVPEFVAERKWHFKFIGGK